MRALKFVCLLIIGLVRQVCLVPQAATLAIKERRQRQRRNELEIERLDRIRNPSKYLGDDESAG